MAGKTSYSEVQRQDRNGMVRNMIIVVCVVTAVILGVFAWHYLKPTHKAAPKQTAQPEMALSMVPTTIHYYDPQQEKTYDVGTDYIIISDGSSNLKVSTDGTVQKVSSDGTVIGAADSADTRGALNQALNIMDKDKQAGMALSGLRENVENSGALKEDDKDVLPPPPSSIDVLYKTAERLGYDRDEFNRIAYSTGGSPQAAAELIDMGMGAEIVIKSMIKKSEEQTAVTETAQNKGGLTVDIQHVGMDDGKNIEKETEEDEGYPDWMDDSDPMAGLQVALDSLASAAAGSPAPPTSWENVNKQQEKNEWQQGQQRVELSASRLTPYDLVAGTTVPITIVTGVNTDLPGSIVGIVRENVYDTLTGTNILIPKGSRLMATYNNSVSFGQKSVQIAWSQLITPDGYQFSLPGFAGTTPDGYAGVKGKYNGHFWSMLGGALMGSIIDWGSMATSSQVEKLLGEQNTLGDLVLALTDSIVNTSASVGQRYAEMWMNLQPTIKIKTGTQTQLLVNQTISLKRPANTMNI